MCEVRRGVDGEGLVREVLLRPGSVGQVGSEGAVGAGAAFFAPPHKTNVRQHFSPPAVTGARWRQADPQPAISSADV